METITNKPDEITADCKYPYIKTLYIIIQIVNSIPSLFRVARIIQSGRSS